MESWLAKTWKTWIKEFCDKKNVTPIWSTSEEYPGLGLQPPTFRSTLKIRVDGETFTAEASAKSKKEAEQEVARIMMVEKMSREMRLVVNPNLFEDEKANEDPDPISAIKILCDQEKISQPIYSDDKVEGPPHQPIFTLTCKIPALGISCKGTGKTKKDAKKSAASQALVQLKRKLHLDTAGTSNSGRNTYSSHEQVQNSENYISSNWTREKYH